MNNVHASVMPRARKDRLIVKELPDETLVYDLDTDKAHCLNETASIVWKNCDGKKTLTELRHALGENTAMPDETSVVWLALEQLESFRLLEECSHLRFAGINRRQVLRTLGVTAVALPAIATLVVPIAAEAQSCTGGSRPNGCTCSNNNQCASNNCVAGKCCPTSSPC